PAGVVGRVAILLHAVGRELGLTARREVLREEIVVLDVDRGPSVRRDARVLGRRHAATRGISGRATVLLQVAGEAPVADVDSDRSVVLPELERLERQPIRVDASSG